MTSSERTERWCQLYRTNFVTDSAKNPTPSTVTKSDDHQAGAFASASSALGATRETHAAGWPGASGSASQGHADAISAVAFTAAATQRSHRETRESGSESSGDDTSVIVLSQGATAARAWPERTREASADEGKTRERAAQPLGSTPGCRVRAPRDCGGATFRSEET